jgi:hypothetical protein
MTPSPFAEVRGDEVYTLEIHLYPSRAQLELF